jgi:hypothetical protein
MCVPKSREIDVGCFGVDTRYRTHIHMLQLAVSARNAVIYFAFRSRPRSLNLNPCGLSSSTSSRLPILYPECHKVSKSTVSRLHSHPFQTSHKVPRLQPTSKVHRPKFSRSLHSHSSLLSTGHSTRQGFLYVLTYLPINRAQLTSFYASPAPRRSPCHSAASRRGGTTQLPVGDRTCPR